MKLLHFTYTPEPPPSKCVEGLHSILSEKYLKFRGDDVLEGMELDGSIIPFLEGIVAGSVKMEVRRDADKLIDAIRKHKNVTLFTQ